MPQSPDNDPEQHRMPLIEHLLELRQRLLFTVASFLIAFVGCFYLAGDIYSFLVRPLAVVMEAHGGSQRMIYTAVTEAFVTYLKVAAFSAFVITFPILATQLWLFIAPGLYKHEKKVFLPFLVATPILFLLGAGIVYVFVMPLAWHYLLSFQSSGAETMLPIQLEAKVSEYLDVVMTLMLAFGTCFELPVALTLMAKVGLTSAQGLVAKRQFAIVGVFVAAAILTPPDVISQIGLALPLIGLYELSILSCRWIEGQRAKDQQETKHHR
ncbi:Twin-arginine translocation protein TatC [invertebrate metagenome]|uniref:Twin-arginine translocation protein TatC n=1 Tax=invertebrate metagenome TaxID=1711999 RepID=A0A484H5T2_9ZZZZ